MQRVWVVGGVHRHGVRVVIDRNVHAPAGSQLNARARPAASGKVINDNLSHTYSSMAAASERAASTIDGTGIRSSHIRLM